MLRQIGLPELAIILMIVIILFGVGRVSKIGSELGTAIREFRKGLSEGMEDEQEGETEDKP
jgi:sec-independent protein translocase protein TatA